MMVVREQQPNERQAAVLERAQYISRRQQALLAAAGEAVPDRRWHILMLEAGCDNLVDNALTNGRVEHWMPSLSIRPKRRPGRRHQNFAPIVTPAFPGYLFVRVAWSAMIWEALAGVDGVAGVIGGAERPAPLPGKEVERFRLRVEEDPKFLAQCIDALKAGDKVRVEDGPFYGFEGVISLLAEGSRRVTVDVELFGREVPVDLDLAQISKSD